MSLEMNEVPSSSVSQVIPSSTRKLSGTRSSGDKIADRGGQGHLALVNQTPTKGSARFFDRSSLSAGENAIVASSQPRPCGPPNWNSEAQETPSKRPQCQSPMMPRPVSNIQATPCKSIPTQVPIIDTPLSSSQTGEPDLYATLGWNYEIDD